MTRIWPLEPATFSPHPLHRGERQWAESNCYVDLWIELLQAAGHEPFACLAHTIRTDFEGDQWTFFKPPIADLERLYGLEILELNIWDDLLGHVAEQAKRGRLSLVEVDSFWLPDTGGTAYRTHHLAKTTIAVHALDVEARRLGYFHNAGYYELGGDDFAGVFKLGEPASLPPYVEFVKLDRSTPPPVDELVRRSVATLRGHVAARPMTNPFTLFRQRFPADLEKLRARGVAAFHLYSFATLRQFGAAFEFSGAYLRWLETHGETGLADAATRFTSIAEGAKVLQFKLARAVNTGKPLDPTAAFDAMEASWTAAMDLLVARYG